MQRIRRGQRVETFETVRQCKNGSLIDVALTVSPVRNAQGKIVGASKIARDITERKRTEEANRRDMCTAEAVNDARVVPTRRRRSDACGPWPGAA